MDERGHGRLGHLIPVLLFVLFFVLCCGVLTGVFLRAGALSQQTRAYSAAVQLCRNEAERYRAGQAGPGSRWYNETFRPSSEEAGVYRIEITQSSRAEAAGQLLTGTIRAYDREGQPLYELEAAIFRSAEEETNGE